MSRRLVVLSLLGAVAAAGTGVAAAAPAPDPQGRCVTIGAPKVGGNEIGKPHRVCVPRAIPGG